MSCVNDTDSERFIKYGCLLSIAFMSVGSLIMTKTNIQFLELARSKIHEIGTIVSIL